MKTQIKLFLLVAIIVPFLSSCFTDIMVVGNNDFVEESRVIGDFKRVSSSGNFHIYYEYAAEPEVVVVAESNLLEHIEIRTVGSELRIGTPFAVNLRTHKTVEVFVKGPYVDQIHLSGSGVIVTDTIYAESLSLRISGSGDIETYFVGKDFESKVSGSGKMFLYTVCDNMNIEISGSGRINLEGEADRSQYRISGSAKIDAYDFPVNSAQVNISGSGNLYLNVFDQLTGNISGSGNLYYIGNPSVNILVSGSGKVISDRR